MRGVKLRLQGCQDDKDESNEKDECREEENDLRQYVKDYDERMSTPFDPFIKVYCL